MAEPNHVDAVKDEHMSQVEPAEDELDASLDADIDMTGTQQPSSMIMDGAGEESGTAANLNPVEEVLDSKTPSRKDATLREFLGQMDDYAPIVRRRHLEPPLLLRQPHILIETTIYYRSQTPLRITIS